MTTVEKLLVQIFERKNSIIEQVKQQTELYSQHLASKLLIDGITPPSWLWNPNTSGSKELNKEELISKLLHPYPQQSARCSVAHYPGYNNLVITGDNEEFSDGVFMENPVFNKGLNRKDDPTVPALSSENHAGCTLNSAPEPATSVTSPEDQTDERILNIYIAPDKSLAGIQRSKSRQKALELRSSAKALAKGGLRHENISDVFSSQIRFSLSATDQAGQNDELPKLAEPYVLGSQSCEDWDVDEADHLSRAIGMDAYSDRITRSRSYAEVPVFVKGSFALSCSSESCKENAFSHVTKVRRMESMPISDSEQADNYVNKLPKSAGPSTACCQSGGDRRVDDADFLSKDTETNVYTGRITRSKISSKRQSCGCDSSKADNSSDDYQGTDIAMADTGDDLPPECVDGSLVNVNPSDVCNEGCDARESIPKDCKRHKETDTSPSWSSIQHNAGVNEVSDLEIPSHSAKVDGGIFAASIAGSAQRVNDSHEVLGLVKPSVGLFRRVTRSQSRSNDKETYQPVAYNENSSFGDTMSKSDSKQKSAEEELQNTSNGQSIPPCYGTFNMLHDDENGSIVMVRELVLHDHIDQSCSSSSTYAKRRRELESQVAPTPSDSFVLVEPKQLDFKEIEEYNLKAFTSTSGKRRLDNSPEKMSCSLSVPDVSLDEGISGGANQLSLGKQSPGMSNVSSRGDKAQRDSFESDVQGNPDTQAENFGPVISDTMLKASQDNTEAGLNCKISEVHHEADSTLSKMVDIPDIRIHPVKLHVEHGLESLPGQHMEKASSSLRSNISAQKMTFSKSCAPLKKRHHGCSIYQCKQQKEKKTYPSLGLPEDWSGWSARVLFEINPVTNHLLSGDRNGEGKDKGQLMSSAPESKNSRLSHCHSSAKEARAESYDCLIKNVEMTNPIAIDEMKLFPAQQSQILSCLEGEVCSQHGDSSLGDNALGTHSIVKSRDENSSLERRFRHASMESWPQLKRRKIEHQRTHSFTTSPIFWGTKPHSIQRGPASTYLKTTELNVDNAFMEHVNKSTDVEICPETNYNLMEGIESTFLSQHGEVGPCYKEKNEHKSSSSDINYEQLGDTLASSLTMKESRNSQGCFVEGIRTSHSSGNNFDARMLGDEQFSQHLCNLEKNTDNLNSKNLTPTNTLLEGIQSPKWEGGLQTQPSVLSPSNEDLELTDVDQSMPVFEGFIVDAQTDSGELEFAPNGFDFDELNLPRTTLERASILAEICRSASLDTPLSHFSSSFEYQGTQNLFQSVPNGGYVEHLDLGDAFPLNSDVGKHLQSGSSSSDDYKDALDGMPYSACLAYSGARYGWNSRNHHTSPVGKLWERLSSHTGSSEKRLSSNPELTCFPIEEDPSMSEENLTVDENADDVQEEINSSLAKHCDKRQPLKDLTNLGLSCPMSVSGEEETLREDSVDFVCTNFSVTGTQEKVHCGQKYQYRNKSETSKKQTSSTGATDGRRNQPSSVGANGIKKAKESIKNGIRKPIVSNGTSLKGQDQKLSLKESRRNNIVSNVSSFIPLIQQKQAATACAGKRDVKVKALEAAETAKRLEEKRENERQMRKEALKLERAKLEEKNLRHMELEKKKKEEERKKKDADLIVKKRLREEEERKGKEKKRMRLEARQQQREQEEKKRAEKEEKKRAEKAEKETQRSKDERMNSNKEFHNESKNQQNRETTQGDGVALQKTQTNLTLTKVVMNYEECGSSGLSCEAGKAMHTMEKSPRNEDLIVQNSQGKSYEISPYQCSDDEDEEDDELPTKKYIPTWASKSSVALFLPLQQQLDPDAIFPPENFCSVDEVEDTSIEGVGWQCKKA